MTGLSDSERASIEQLFVDCAGSLHPFTFVEPSVNLLAYSDALSLGNWVVSPGLVLAQGQGDPTGGVSATLLSNPTAGPLVVSQVIPAPSWYAYVGSLYCYSATPTVLTIDLGPIADLATREFAPNAQWQRVAVPVRSQSTEEAIDFRITVAPLSEVLLFGAQVELGQAPSVYKANGAETGLYPNCRFQNDSIAWEATGINSHTVDLSLLVTYDANY
jgi:hypothetical protein